MAQGGDEGRGKLRGATPSVARPMIARKREANPGN